MRAASVEEAKHVNAVRKPANNTRTGRRIEDMRARCEGFANARKARVADLHQGTGQAMGGGCQRAGGRIGCAVMKIKTAEFERSSTGLEAAPRWNLSEVAFIGRSNVGKSSLINLLAERRALAKVSATPGKTQLINFFRINGNWSLVDLPGYGYAKVAKEKRADFNEAVADYLEKRKNIAGIFVLVDSRLEPQRIDLDFLKWVKTTGVPHAIIFTKTDKHSATQTREKIALFKQALSEWGPEVPPILTSSSETKIGRGEILGQVEEWVEAKNKTRTA